MADAETLGAMSTAPEIQAVLTKAADAQLSPIETSKLIATIAAATKMPKKALNDELKQIAQQGIATSDIALIIAQTTLNSDFNDIHLKLGVDGQYWRYNKTHWQPAATPFINNLLMKTSVKLSTLDGKKSIPALVNSARSCLNHLLGSDDDVLGLTETPLPVINCSNGELWIEADGSVVLKPHRPESRLTSCLSVAYDPVANCPKYDAALSGIFSKSKDTADVVRHWHEFVGYAIQPKRDIASFWMLIGHGNNGKSSLLKTLQKLVGPGSVLNDSIGGFQKDSFSMAALNGKLLFIDDDMAEEITLADGLLKKISEAKEISARHVYGRKFNFVSRALVVMAGNSYPKTRDVSRGMIRRANVFPFDNAFDKNMDDGKDKDDPTLFPAIWENELSGVLNRAVEGLTRLRKRGGFEVPFACEMALLDFMTHAMPLIAFLEEGCDLDPDGRVRLSVFRERFKEWARQQGVKNIPGDKALKRKLLGLDIKVSDVKGYPTIYGLVLKNQINLVIEE